MSFSYCRALNSTKNLNYCCVHFVALLLTLPLWLQLHLLLPLHILLPLQLLLTLQLLLPLQLLFLLLLLLPLHLIIPLLLKLLLMFMLMLPLQLQLMLTEFSQPTLIIAVFILLRSYFRSSSYSSSHFRSCSCSRPGPIHTQFS